MRIAPAFLLCAAALLSCKKHPKPTLPPLPDSNPMAAGDNIDLPETTIFHTMARYPGHANQVFAFYAAELEKRGARQVGDTFADGNLVHSGGFGRNGSATVKDPSQPGVWLGVVETPDSTTVDIWEAVPKPR
jgi:hypothetical protein